MTKEHTHSNLPFCGCCMSKARSQITRRQFIDGVSAAAGGLAMTSWLNAANSSYTQGLKPAPPYP